MEFDQIYEWTHRGHQFITCYRVVTCEVSHVGKIMLKMRNSRRRKSFQWFPAYVTSRNHVLSIAMTRVLSTSSKRGLTRAVLSIKLHLGLTLRHQSLKMQAIKWMFICLLSGQYVISLSLKMSQKYWPPLDMRVKYFNLVRILIQVINRNFTFHSAVDVGAEQMKQFEFGEIRCRLVIRLMGLEKLHV